MSVCPSVRPPAVGPRSVCCSGVTRFVSTEQRWQARNRSPEKCISLRRAESPSPSEAGPTRPAPPPLPASRLEAPGAAPALSPLRHGRPSLPGAPPNFFPSRAEASSRCSCGERGRRWVASPVGDTGPEPGGRWAGVRWGRCPPPPRRSSVVVVPPPPAPVPENASATSLRIQDCPFYVAARHLGLHS